MTDQSGASRSADARRRGKLREKPISDAYPEIDNDLARDNLENDIPAADLEDLCPTHGAAAVPAADALHNKTQPRPAFSRDAAASLSEVFDFFRILSENAPQGESSRAIIAKIAVGFQAPLRSVPAPGRPGPPRPHPPPC